jgi:hypothetical protein
MARQAWHWFEPPRRYSHIASRRDASPRALSQVVRQGLMSIGMPPTNRTPPAPLCHLEEIGRASVLFYFILTIFSYRACCVPGASEYEYVVHAGQYSTVQHSTVLCVHTTSPRL